MNGFTSPTEAQQRNSKASERVHMLLCTNASFLQHAAVCLASVLANNPGLFFNVVVVSQPEENLDEDKLHRSVAQFANHRLTFRQFTIPSDPVLPLIPGYSVDTYTRIWVSAFFPADARRVLYLDSDIVVVGSIAPLWNADLDGALMAAVDIPGSDRGVRVLGLQAEDGYFNAGVLIFDLEQWRATGAEQEILAYIRDYPERVAYDQDALNACFYNRTKRLDYTWNVIWPFFRDPPALPLPQSELDKVCREAQVIHFNGASKPWSYFCEHPRRAEYEKYLRMTEWRDFVPVDRTPLNMLRKTVSAILPERIKPILKAMLFQRSSSQRPAGV